MKHTILSLLLFIGTVSAQAEPQSFAWRDSAGNPVPDTASMKSKDGFGGELILSSNENIYAEWAKPETPTIEVAATLPVGKLLVPVVIFVNPAKDKDGLINVTYDLEILKPDGSVARTMPDIVCWKGSSAGPEFNLQLSRSQAKWGADSNDPLGVWTFKVVLKDNVRGTNLPLQATVEVTPQKPDTSAQPKR